MTTPDPEHAGASFRLGPWRVEPRERRLVSADQALQLDPRTMALLSYFAERPGALVSRDDLLDAVWEDVVVSENTLTQAISRLRRSLGDDRRTPRFIETVSKSGYRLVAAVEPLERDAVEVVSRPSPPPVEASGGYGRARLWLPPFAILAGLAAFFFRPTVTPPTAVPVVRPALTQTGKTFDPTLSPDGVHIAFAWQGPDQGKEGAQGEPADNDIWVQRVDGGEAIPIAAHEDEERMPMWSPDGSSLLFVRFSAAEERCGLFRIPLIGGTARRVIDCPRGGNWMDMAPDGRTVAASLAAAPGAVPAIVLVDLESGARRQLTQPPEGSRGDRRPAISPDGRWIAFERRESAFRHRLMVIPADGGAGSEGPRALTDDPWGQLRGSDWSADGRSLLFSSNREGRFVLWRVSVDGGTPERFPIEDDWITQPSLSRDGRRLIYRTFRDVVSLHVLPLASPGVAAAAPELIVPSTRSERDPTFAPDGQHLAFLSDRSGTLELWSGRIDGTGLVRHTDFAGPRPESVGWSPDGRVLVFDAAVDGHADLWRVEADGGRPRRLTTDPANERNPSFSRDGTSIYFASDRLGGWQVFRMPTAGGAPVPVTEDGAFRALESLDGAFLLTVQPDRPGIWRRPLAGGEPTLLVEDLDLLDWASWTVATGGVYYVRRGPTEIVYQPFAGDALVVYEPGNQLPYHAHDLSLSPDGRQLLFASIDRSDDEVMWVEM